MAPHQRGLGWRRWQERRRLGSVLSMVRFRNWFGPPEPIAARHCCIRAAHHSTGRVCDLADPDPSHCHRWEDVFSARLKAARKLRARHSICSCGMCGNPRRHGDFLTYHERLDRVSVHEQVGEEAIKMNCIAAPRLRGRT